MIGTGFRRARGGFTLVELLVVMAIIGILIAMLMPALSAVRERARRTQCNNKVKEINTALQSHLESRGYFPAGNKDKNGTDISWLISILPMIEGQNFYDNIDQTKAWNHADNQAATYVHFEAYRCPSIDDMFPGQCDYAGVDGSIAAPANPDTSPTSARVNGPLFDQAYGSGVLIPRNAGVLAANPKINDTHITDGMSNTMIFAEDGGRTTSMDGHYWGDGNQIIGVDQLINTTNDNEIFSAHPGGAIIAFADGRSRFIDETVALHILAKLAIRDDGQILSGDDY